MRFDHSKPGVATPSSWEYADRIVVPPESTWKPARLEREVDLAEFHYAVVEEAMGDVVVLLIAPWPEAGSGGRPYFPYDVDELVLAADREALEQRLAERRLDAAEERLGEISPSAREELSRRRLSVGDVFAFKIADDFDISTTPDEPLREFDWIAEAIDFTAEAREAAKEKMYEALTPPVKEDVAAELLGEEEQGA
jgi:hypothetical protein